MADFIVGSEEFIFNVDDFGGKLINLRLLYFAVGEDGVLSYPETRQRTVYFVDIVFPRAVQL